MSYPQIETFPVSAAKQPAMIFMVVDLPAPLGPKNPVMPWDAEKDIPFKTGIFPKDFVKFVTLIISKN